jgi:hypothetical protein
MIPAIQKDNEVHQNINAFIRVTQPSNIKFHGSFAMTIRPFTIISLSKVFIGGRD